MAKVCVELSDLVVLSGFASFGLLVLDHANNDGKVLAQIKHFYNEVKQSVVNGDEHSKGIADEATSKADGSNDGQENTCSGDEQKQKEAVGKAGVKNNATNEPEQ